MAASRRTAAVDVRSWATDPGAVTARDGRRRIVFVVLAASACGGESFVEGDLRLSDLEGSAASFDFAEIRAFPEYPEGFSVRGIYRGNELLQQSVLLRDTELPVSFRLEGYDVGEPGGPWRVLAWLTNRENSSWVGTGEPYGTRAFAFDCSTGPLCTIGGVDIDVAQLAPDN